MLEVLKVNINNDKIKKRNSTIHISSRLTQTPIVGAGPGAVGGGHAIPRGRARVTNGSMRQTLVEAVQIAVIVAARTQTLTLVETPRARQIGRRATLARVKTRHAVVLERQALAHLLAVEIVGHALTYVVDALRVLQTLTVRCARL